MTSREIAVLLPVYRLDVVDYVRQGVGSILQQTYPQLKLFVGVDGPVDEDLCSFLESLEDSRVQVSWYADNRGLACVLNDLLEVCFARGYEFVARMDADDVSMPDRLEKELAYLLAHDEADVVGGAIEEIDKDGCSRHKTVVYPAVHDDYRAFFAYRNPHAHPSVLFRRRFFEKCGRLYRPEYRRNQDTMLWFDGMMNGTVHANIPDVVLQHRMTDSFFKYRRNGYHFACKQLKDRLMINRELRYGFGATLFALAMFLLLASPPWLKKIAYRLFR